MGKSHKGLRACGQRGRMHAATHGSHRQRPHAHMQGRTGETAVQLHSPTPGTPGLLAPAMPSSRAHATMCLRFVVDLMWWNQTATRSRRCEAPWGGALPSPPPPAARPAAPSISPRSAPSPDCAATPCGCGADSKKGGCEVWKLCTQGLKHGFECSNNTTGTTAPPPAGYAHPSPGASRPPARGRARPPTRPQASAGRR